LADENAFALTKICRIIYVSEYDSFTAVLTKFKSCYIIRILRRKPVAKKGKKGKKGKKR